MGFVAKQDKLGAKAMTELRKMANLKRDKLGNFFGMVAPILLATDALAQPISTYCNSECQAAWIMAKASVVGVALTLVSLIILAAAAHFARRAAVSGGEMVEEAKRATDAAVAAANRSAALSEHALRVSQGSYVFAEPPEWVAIDFQRPYAVVSLVNGGRGTVTLTELRAEMFMLRPGPAPVNFDACVSHEDADGANIAGDGQSFALDVPSRERLQGDEIPLRITSDDWHVYVLGRARYTDVFDARHELAFAFRSRMNNMRFRRYGGADMNYRRSVAGG